MAASRVDSTTLIAGDEPVIEGDPRWQVAERAAHSSTLSRATQLQAILLFIVHKAICQPEAAIHEADVAQHVLGRSVDFNPVDDNIVRVQMARLRKKLEAYFASEGQSEELIISIALGSYKPVFSHRSDAAARLNPHNEPEIGSGEFREDGARTVAADAKEPAAAYRASSRLFQIRWMIAALLVVALAGCSVALWIQNRAMERALYPWRHQPTVSAFWSDFLGVHKDTDIVTPDALYKLAQDLTGKRSSLNEYLSGAYIRQVLDHEKDPDVVSIWKKVAGWSSLSENHLQLAQRIVTLDPLGKSIHIYYSRDYSPDRLKQNNVILLGSELTNPWYDLFDGRMNFRALSESDGYTTITNRATAPGEQKIYDRNDPVGYCVVAYLPGLGNNAKVLLIGGTSTQATEAGGDFLLSENQLADFEKKLHVTKLPYFEVLLKTTQASQTLLTETVVAYRTYPNLH